MGVTTGVNGLLQTFRRNTHPYLHGSSTWDLNGVTSPHCYACAVCESKLDGSMRSLYPL